MTATGGAAPAAAREGQTQCNTRLFEVPRGTSGCDYRLAQQSAAQQPCCRTHPRSRPLPPQVLPHQARDLLQQLVDAGLDGTGRLQGSAANEKHTHCQCIRCC